MGLGSGFVCCLVQCDTTLGSLSDFVFDPRIGLGFHAVSFGPEVSTVGFPWPIVSGVPPNLFRLTNSLVGNERILLFEEIDGNGNYVFKRSAVAIADANDDIEITLVLDGNARNIEGPGGVNTCMEFHTPISLDMDGTSINGPIRLTFKETFYNPRSGLGGKWLGDRRKCPPLLNFNTFMTAMMFRHDQAPTITAVISGITNGPGNTGQDCAGQNGSFVLSLQPPQGSLGGTPRIDGWILGSNWTFFGGLGEAGVTFFSGVTGVSRFGSTDFCTTSSVFENPFPISAAVIGRWGKGVFFSCPHQVFLDNGVNNRSDYFDTDWTDLVVSAISTPCPDQCDYSGISFTITQT